MHVVSIVGARPQFIKAAPFSRALRKEHHEFLVHTGQHYDPEMSDIFFEELEIPRPDINLGIGAESNLEQVSHMMLALHPIIETQNPDWIVVYGDTNSTLAGALTGQLLNVPVAHIEAGLRSYNRAMPEEHNRVLTDHISSALFCPTQVAADNLARESITSGVFVVGDVMIDALLQNRSRAQERIGLGIMAANGLRAKEFFLVTIHRASNTDNQANLSGILDALARFPDVRIVVTVHPRLRKMLDQFGLSPSPNVLLILPVGYLDMLALSSSARLILTDSGGLQKEAYALHIPCVTLREETEWIETVTAGWNRLTGPDCAKIVSGVREALAPPPADRPDFYGSGDASVQIVKALESLGS
ncbi:MAG: UDP-N-acetylglucosamine 2-epimerase (non-hydrolyzing) [Anaerolineae bacterium]|nr:UDP-N-acetylglucosamine 2-epimerase (non-hydrolyzing) [Anaerolineae bacterium]